MVKYCKEIGTFTNKRNNNDKIRFNDVCKTTIDCNYYNYTNKKMIINEK